MHDAALIRLISGKIHRGNRAGRIDELLRLLRAVIQNDPEDVHMGGEFIRKKYAIASDQAISCRFVTPGES
jgi:hypothetical protein